MVGLYAEDSTSIDLAYGINDEVNFIQIATFGNIRYALNQRTHHETVA